MSVSVGFIGSGAIAHEHARALARIEGARIHAWCDVARERAYEALDHHGGEYATDNVDLLLADDTVDVVYICTWHDSHAELVERACAAERPVVLEKPMAITMRDLDRIVDAVERSGVLVMTALKLRFYPMVSRAREFVHSPVLLAGSIHDNRWPDTYWAQDRIKGGGNVLSQGPHAFDLLCHLARSEPVRISAEGGAFTHVDREVIDNIAATIRFANGAVASVAIGDSGTTPAVSKFSFTLADGRRTVQLHDRLREGTFFDGSEVVVENDAEELGMLEENRAFIRTLRGEIPPPTTHVDGYRASLLAIKAVESVRTGRPQEIHLRRAATG